MKYVLLLFCALLVSCVTTKTNWANPDTDNRDNMPSLITAIDSVANADTSLATMEFELIDRQDKEPIPFAIVVLSDSGQKYTAYTYMDGIAKFKQAPGNYKITIAYVGYNTLSSVITVSKRYKYKIKIGMGSTGQMIRCSE